MAISVSSALNAVPFTHGAALTRICFTMKSRHYTDRRYCSSCHCLTTQDITLNEDAILTVCDMCGDVRSLPYLHKYVD